MTTSGIFVPYSSFPEQTGCAIEEASNKFKRITKFIEIGSLSEALIADFWGGIKPMMKGGDRFSDLFRKVP